MADDRFNPIQKLGELLGFKAPRNEIDEQTENKKRLYEVLTEIEGNLSPEILPDSERLNDVLSSYEVDINNVGQMVLEYETEGGARGNLDFHPTNLSQIERNELIVNSLDELSSKHRLESSVEPYDFYRVDRLDEGWDGSFEDVEEGKFYVGENPISKDYVEKDIIFVPEQQPGNLPDGQYFVETLSVHENNLMHAGQMTRSMIDREASSAEIKLFQSERSLHSELKPYEVALDERDGVEMEKRNGERSLRDLLGPEEEEDNIDKEQSNGERSLKDLLGPEEEENNIDFGVKPTERDLIGFDGAERSERSSNILEFEGDLRDAFGPEENEDHLELVNDNVIEFSVNDGDQLSLRDALKEADAGQIPDKIPDLNVNITQYAYLDDDVTGDGYDSRLVYSVEGENMNRSLLLKDSEFSHEERNNMLDRFEGDSFSQEQMNKQIEKVFEKVFEQVMER